MPSMTRKFVQRYLSFNNSKEVCLKEKEIENLILEFLHLKGINCWKNQSVGIYDSRRKVYRKNHNRYHRNGVSDIIGVLRDGKFLAIEVKTVKGRPTENQKSFIESVEKNNGIAFIARSIDDVIECLKEYL